MLAREGKCNFELMFQEIACASFSAIQVIQ
jgi:hypothetical protein